MRWLLASCFVLCLSAAPPDAKECVQCHDTVDLEKFRHRSHGGLACVQCHSDIKALPHEEKLAPVRCERCHSHEGMDYALSVHGVAKQKGKEHAPTCSNCHGPAHEIVTKSNPASRVARKNMDATCGKCHPAEFLAKLSTKLSRRTSRMGLQEGDIK